MTSGLVVARAGARRRRKQRKGIVRWAARGLFVLIVLVIGVAVGEALHDNPKPGTSTFERTLTIPSVPPGSTAIPAP